MKIISTTDAIINESWLKFISWNLKLCAVIFVTIVHCECDFCGCSVEARPDGLTVGMWCTPPGRVPLSSILQNLAKIIDLLLLLRVREFLPYIALCESNLKLPTLIRSSPVWASSDPLELRSVEIVDDSTLFCPERGVSAKLHGGRVFVNRSSRIWTSLNSVMINSSAVLCLLSMVMVCQIACLNWMIFNCMIYNGCSPPVCKILLPLKRLRKFNFEGTFNFLFYFVWRTIPSLSFNLKSCIVQTSISQTVKM